MINSNATQLAFGSEYSTSGTGHIGDNIVYKKPIFILN